MPPPWRLCFLEAAEHLVRRPPYRGSNGGNGRGRGRSAARGGARAAGGTSRAERGPGLRSCGFTEQGMCMLLWGQAMLQWPPHPAFLDAYYASLEGRLGGLGAGGSLSLVAWATAKLGFVPTDGWLERVVGRMEETVGLMDDRDLANAMWAIVKMTTGKEERGRLVGERLRSLVRGRRGGGGGVMIVGGEGCKGGGRAVGDRGGGGDRWDRGSWARDAGWGDGWGDAWADELRVMHVWVGVPGWSGWVFGWVCGWVGGGRWLIAEGCCVGL